MAAIEEVYRCGEPGCGWVRDGRYHPAEEENNRIDAHAMGHGKRCRPYEPHMGRLIATAGMGKRWAIDEWGEWWSWSGGKWNWEPFGQEDSNGG
jgi:hypothetical protein